MSAESLVKLITITQRSLDLNLDGFTHEESLAQPAAGNCVNWLLGHILVHRNIMLASLDAPPSWTHSWASRYDRGSAAITGDGPDVVPLAELREALTASCRALVDVIERGGNELVARNSALPAGRRVDLLIFHEAYHAGQVGLLRRIVGRPGAIS